MFKAWLVAVADMRVHYIESFDVPLCKPSLYVVSMGDFSYTTKLENIV